MKIWESTHVFDHPWERVCHGVLRKYPNPINPVVTGVDTLVRNVDENGILHSERLMQTTWDIPGWVTGLIGLRNPSYSHEQSEVDPSNRLLTLKTVNLDCTTFIAVDEQLRYTPHPDDDQKTILTQSTEIRMFNVPWVDRLEQMMLDKFTSNSHIGRNALEWVIGNVRREYDELAAKVTGEVHQLTNKLTADITKTVDKQRRAIGEARSSDRFQGDTGDIRLA